MKALFIRVAEQFASKNEICEEILTICEAITPQEILKLTSIDSRLLQVIGENRNFYYQ